MHVKFRIVFEDDTAIESHDPMFNEIRDHCHALPPYNTKRWKAYHLVTDYPINGNPNTPLTVGVNFQTGIFHMNGNEIHPADIEDDAPLTHLTDPQNFELKDGWEILNGLPYIPVVGKRIYKGDWGESKLFFCGWKRKRGERTIVKKMLIYPTSAVVFV